MPVLGDLRGRGVCDSARLLPHALRVLSALPMMLGVALGLAIVDWWRRELPPLVILSAGVLALSGVLSGWGSWAWVGAGVAWGLTALAGLPGGDRWGMAVLGGMVPPEWLAVWLIGCFGGLLILPWLIRRPAGMLPFFPWVLAVLVGIIGLERGLGIPLH